MWVSCAVLFASSFGSGLLLRRFGKGLDAPEELNAARAAKLEAAKSFASAVTGDEVVVEGVVAAGPAGPIEAPVSGTPAAWVRLDTTEERSTDADASFERINTVRRGPFEVALPDGSSVLVRVEDVGGLSPKKSGPVVRPSARLAKFLEEGGAATPSPDDFVRRREYVETVLPVGSPIFVLGTKRGGTGPAAGAGAGASAYRDAPSVAWVEASMADVTLDTQKVLRAGKPDGPGLTTTLGWVWMIAGTLASGLALVLNMGPEVSWSLFAPPLVALGVWFTLGLGKLIFFD